jgi:hypothetical protein
MCARWGTFRPSPPRLVRWGTFRPSPPRLVPTKARPHQGSDRRLFARDPSNVKPSAGSSHRDDCGRLVEDDPRRFGFHNLRHSLASFLVRIRTDPKTVQTLLRYGDFKLTLQFLQPRCQPGSHGRRGGNVNCDSQPRGGAAAGLFRDSLGPFGLFSTVRWVVYWS